LFMDLSEILKATPAGATFFLRNSFFAFERRLAPREGANY